MVKEVEVASELRAVAEVLVMEIIALECADQQEPGLCCAELLSSQILYKQLYEWKTWCLLSYG